MWVFEFQLPIVDISDEHFLRINLSACPNRSVRQSKAVRPQNDIADVVWRIAVINQVMLFSRDQEFAIVVGARWIDRPTIGFQTEFAGLSASP